MDNGVLRYPRQGARFAARRTVHISIDPALGSSEAAKLSPEMQMCDGQGMNEAGSKPCSQGGTGSSLPTKPLRHRVMQVRAVLNLCQ